MKTGVGRLLQGKRVFGPEMRENPYQTYRELRTSAPVLWDESLHAWVLTRYDDAALVLNDARFSSNRLSAADEQLRTDRYRPLLDVMSNKMTEKDEPDHTRLRSLVNKAFIRVEVERWEPSIRRRVDGLLAGFRSANQCDFIRDFAVPLPLVTILEIIGIPDEDRAKVKLWCDDFSFIALNFFTPMPDEQIERGFQSIQEFRVYLERRIAALDTSSRDGLLAALVTVEHESERLNIEELLANTFLLLSAGNETTTCLLGNGLAALLRFPDQMQRLRDDPSLIPSAIEEFLRFDSPVQFIGRVAVEDVAIGDAQIRKDDLVLAVLAAANRDPDHFAEPDSLDVGRRDNHHLAFGHGRHFCAGAQLARMEAKVAFQALLDQTSQISLEGITLDELSHNENFNIRCLKQLPLSLTFRS